MPFSTQERPRNAATPEPTLPPDAAPSTRSSPKARGAELRALRLRKGWTQERLALAVGCERSYVSRWEREGRLSEEMRRRVVSALAGAPDTPAGVASPRPRRRPPAPAPSAALRQEPLLQQEASLGLDAVVYCILAMERIYACRSLDEVRAAASEMRQQLRAYETRLKHTFAALLALALVL